MHSKLIDSMVLYFFLKARFHLSFETIVLPSPTWMPFPVSWLESPEVHPNLEYIHIKQVAQFIILCKWAIDCKILLFPFFLHSAEKEVGNISIYNPKNSNSVVFWNYRGSLSLSLAQTHKNAQPVWPLNTTVCRIWIPQSGWDEGKVVVSVTT